MNIRSLYSQKFRTELPARHLRGQNMFPLTINNLNKKVKRDQKNSFKGFVIKNKRSTHKEASSDLELNQLRQRHRKLTQIVKRESSKGSCFKQGNRSNFGDRHFTNRTQEKDSSPSSIAVLKQQLVSRYKTANNFYRNPNPQKTFKNETSLVGNHEQKRQDSVRVLRDRKYSRGYRGGEIANRDSRGFQKRTRTYEKYNNLIYSRSKNYFNTTKDIQRKITKRRSEQPQIVYQTSSPFSKTSPRPNNPDQDSSPKAKIHKFRMIKKPLKKRLQEFSVSGSDDDGKPSFHKILDNRSQGSASKEDSDMSAMRKTLFSTNHGKKWSTWNKTDKTPLLDLINDSFDYAQNCRGHRNGIEINALTSLEDHMPDLSLIEVESPHIMRTPSQKKKRKKMKLFFQTSSTICQSIVD